MIQLDTSFLMRGLLPDSAEAKRFRQWLEDGEHVGISALAWAEFQCGPVSAKVIALAERVLGEPVPFARAEAELSARLFNETGRRRGTFVDCMIAATAIASEEALATSNPKDFARFEKFGLALAG